MYLNCTLNIHVIS